MLLLIALAVIKLPNRLGLIPGKTLDTCKWDVGSTFEVISHYYGFLFFGQVQAVYSCYIWLNIPLLADFIIRLVCFLNAHWSTAGHVVCNM